MMSLDCSHVRFSVKHDLMRANVLRFWEFMTRLGIVVRVDHDLEAMTITYVVWDGTNRGPIKVLDRELRFAEGEFSLTPPPSTFDPECIVARARAVIEHYDNGSIASLAEAVDDLRDSLPRRKGHP